MEYGENTGVFNYVKPQKMLRILMKNMIALDESVNLALEIIYREGLLEHLISTVFASPKKGHSRGRKKRAILTYHHSISIVRPRITDEEFASLSSYLGARLRSMGLLGPEGDHYNRLIEGPLYKRPSLNTLMVFAHDICPWHSQHSIESSNYLHSQFISAKNPRLSYESH